jgi:hypothetical protein
VDDGYFSDAVFIGNSLEEGFMLYGGLNEADYFAAKSITVKNIYTEKAVKAGGEYVTIMEALGGKAYSKVYILLGLNEIHLGTETFVRSYSALIDKVRELQPGAELYIQSLTPVSKAQSESGSKFSNERIREYNRALMRLARGQGSAFRQRLRGSRGRRGQPAGGLQLRRDTPVQKVLRAMARLPENAYGLGGFE